MLLRTSIILAYLMTTLLSSAPAVACPDMSSEMMAHSPEMQQHGDMASESSMTTSDMTNSAMTDCDGGCLITCMAYGASIQDSPVSLATTKFHNYPIQQNIPDQVLAAHNARNFRPPIS
jgi:hypothetical protein